MPDVSFGFYPIIIIPLFSNLRCYMLKLCSYNHTVFYHVLYKKLRAKNGVL